MCIIYRLISIVSCCIIANFVSAQEPKKPFTVRWFGQSFFQIETPSGKKIVFDPHAIPAFGRPAVQADILLITHEHDDHNQPEVLDGKPGREFRGLKLVKGKSPEWNKIDEKVGNIHIKGVGTYHDAESGMVRGKNMVFIVEAEGLRFVHLGDLGHELSDDQAKAIGAVDVLFVPVGGVYTINGTQAKKVIEKLKPRLYVIPMHYGVPGYDDLLPADEFLEGLANVKKMPLTNELTIAPDMKADAPTVAMLHWQKTAGVAIPPKPKK
jgi:L-ascorbate metabolism protein UlaG (beta-lactamase superfamily)